MRPPQSQRPCGDAEIDEIEVTIAGTDFTGPAGETTASVEIPYASEALVNPRFGVDAALAAR